MYVRHVPLHTHTGELERVTQSSQTDNDTNTIDESYESTLLRERKKFSGDNANRSRELLSLVSTSI